jgi:hypothetical protein
MSDDERTSALRKLLDLTALRRITMRVALSAGLLGLPTNEAAAEGPQARIPVTPVLATDATVRRLKGRHVLRRVTHSFIRLAGHASHSSHSSHSSHASHSSSSHYSGSHFSSSPSPAPTPSAPLYQPPTDPAPEPARAPEPRRLRARTPRVATKAPPLLRDDFSGDQVDAERWRIGVLATPPGSFDRQVITEQAGGLLSITPRAGQDGSHFSGYVSHAAFDLLTSSIAVELRRPAAGATTIVAAAIDSKNWFGFRIEGGQLVIESHTNGKSAMYTSRYDAVLHRFLRLRRSETSPLVAWETSADGVNWTAQYAESAGIPVTAMRIVLSAGTAKSVGHTSPALFKSVTVERTP